METCPAFDVVNCVASAAHAKVGDHVDAWRLFSKLREYEARLQYNCYHHVMVACLKVRRPWCRSA